MGETHGINSGNEDLVELAIRRRLVVSDFLLPSYPSLVIRLVVIEVIEERGSREMTTTSTTKDVLELLPGIAVEACSKTPDNGEDEDELKLIRVLDRVVFVEDGVEHPRKLLDQVEVGFRECEIEWSTDILAILTLEDEVDECRDVLLIEFLECGDECLELLFLLMPFTHPFLKVRRVPEILRVNIDHTAARNSSRTGVL